MRLKLRNVRPSVLPSVLPSVRNLEFPSLVCLQITHDASWGDSVCLDEKNKFDPPSGPLLGPIFLYFRGIFAHTLGFTGGVILLVYASVFVFLTSFRHSPGGIFSLFHNIQFWALWRGFKNRGSKTFRYAFFHIGML